MKKTTTDTQVGVALKQYPVFLAADSLNFYAVVKGKRYGAASFKALETAIATALRDTEFDPSRIEMEDLDTAKRSISGSYKDHLRLAHIRLRIKTDIEGIEDKAGCYELSVGVSATGKHDSKEFVAGSRDLAEKIILAIEQRLMGQEWRQIKPAARSAHYNHGQFESLWANPRAKTRVSAISLGKEAADFIAAGYDVETIETEAESRYWNGKKSETTLTLKNGQTFEIEIREK